MKRIITAAETEKDTRFEDGLSALKDDFDYLLDGLDKLDRDNATLEALEIINEVNNSVNGAIGQVSKILQSGSTREE